MSGEAKCPDCGKWYDVHDMYCGPQTCCPSCRAKREAEKRETRGKSNVTDMFWGG